jgi:hypothetical protein
MNRKRFVFPILRTLPGGGLILLVSLLSRADLCAQVFSGKPELDRSKPVPASVFDGQSGKTSLTSLLNSPPAVLNQTLTNTDAQNLDTRPMMMAFRPLDAMMGHPRLDRAVTNHMRSIYKGKSTFLLEERADPSGWKMILRIEPERDFLVCECLVVFEQKLIADINIDYAEDKQWGWIPSGWNITRMLDDGSMRLLSEAKVISYSINQPIKIEEYH